MPATNAAEIMRTVIDDGQSELERATPGLAFSGFVGGLCVSFGAVALAFFAALNGNLGLVPILFYPLGFLIVFLGQAELFTAHTVSGVAATLKELGYWRSLIRLWVVVLVFNLLGAAFFAVLVAYGKVLPPSSLDYLFKLSDQILQLGFWGVLLRSVLAGWLVGLMVWLVASSKDTISVFFSVFAMALLLPATNSPHCIADSIELLITLFSGNISPLEYLGGFLLPSTIGNAVGGIVLVTLLNWGQVLGSKKKMLLDKYVDGDRETNS